LLWKSYSFAFLPQYIKASPSKKRPIIRVNLLLKRNKASAQGEIQGERIRKLEALRNIMI
jgi:hypothetical protein